MQNLPYYLGNLYASECIKSFVGIVLCALSVWAYGSESSNAYLVVQQGTMPIILTAPHGGKHLLPEVLQRREGTVVTDINTLALVQKTSNALEAMTGKKPYIVGLNVSRKHLDANRAKDKAYEHSQAGVVYDAYHHWIAHYSAHVQRTYPDQNSLLLDIHGQSTEALTIFQGTRNKRTVERLMQCSGEQALSGEQSILGVLAKKGYCVAPKVHIIEEEEHSSYRGGYTVVCYGSHTRAGIDAMQLEFGSALRKADCLTTTAQDLAEAICIFNGRWQMSAKFSTLRMYVFSASVALMATMLVWGGLHCLNTLYVAPQNGL